MKQKIYKLCSVLLTLVIILSTCICAMGTVSANEATYYVSPLGDDSANGLSESTPMKTVNAAIIAAGEVYGEGDTVNIKLIKSGDTAIAWEEGANTVAAHTFNLNVSSLSDTVALGTLGNNLYLGGPTKFENVTLNVGTGSDYYEFCTHGYDFVWGKGATVTGTTRLTLTTVNEKVFDKNITYTFLENFSKDIMFGVWGKPYLNGNLTYNLEGDGKYVLRIGSDQRANGRVFGQLNINQKAGNLDLRFWTTDYSANTAIQIIRSLNAGSLTVTGSRAWTDLKTGEGNQVPYYIINNNLKYNGNIEFTEDNGVFKVTGIDTANNNVIVKKDDVKVIENVTDTFDVSALGNGEYSVEIENKEKPVLIYYLSPLGDDSNNGTAYETPIKTVAKAIALAKTEGMGAGDIVNIKLLYDDNTNNDWGSIAAHDFTLNISSADSTKGWIGTGSGVTLQGPVIFDNVVIYVTNWSSFNMNGKDVKFTNGASFRGNISAIGMNSGAGGTREDDLNLYLGSTVGKEISTSGNYANGTVNGDVNITLDNGSSATIKVGNHEGSSGPTYNGNINFNLKDAGSLTLTGTKYIFGTTANVQFINSANMDMQSIIDVVSGYKNNAATPASVPYYIINNKSGNSDIINFTDVAGKYTIDYSVLEGSSEDYTAIIKNVTTSEEKVLDGDTFTVDAGIYELNFVNEYINNGEKISVFKPIAINLTNEPHNEIEGKLFIGWKKANGEWAELNATYAAGDILTAQYVDISDFAINDISLSENSGLKLQVGFKQTAIDAIPNISEKGVVWAKTDEIKGREILPDQNIVTNWQWDSVNKDNFTPRSTLAAPNKALNQNSASISIAASDYNTFYTARGYVKYTDNNGVEGVLYTLSEATSAYKVACEAEDNKSIYETIINKVKADNKEYVNGIEENDVAIYDKNNTAYKRNTDSYDVFSNISGAGDYISRKRTTYITNTYLKEKINLGWLTDMHIYNVSQTDVDKQVLPILGMFRGSYGWMSSGEATLNRAISQINYATRRYDKTIVTGDSVEAFSYGMYNAMKNLIADKGVNGGVLMTTGNHEFFNETNSDIKGLAPYLNNQEKYVELAKAFPNDPTYYAEILKTSNGEDNAMVIILDNATGKYSAGTAEKLQASIDIAKDKNIPVLIFQHIAMPTFNETETKVYYGTGTDMSFATESTGQGYYNMSNYNKKTDDAEVYDIIRKNSDVIKGIFGGHEHAQMYTEVTALDESGNIIPNKFIPQFLTSDGKNAWVNEIVIEGCSHEYDDCEDTECNLCSGTREEGEHKYDDCDDTDCNVCGATREALDHEYTNDCADTCTRCGDVDENRGHTYDFACSEECSVCGTTNENAEEHTWTDCVDTECDVCGATRTEGEHTYDNACDADCNVCGETRTVEDHVYDNDCDADCNVCGGTRTPSDHVYDSTTDTDCNVCGAVRVIADGFVKEGGVYYYYEDGVKSTETTLVKVNGSWFYLENGAWTKKTALVKYSGSYFYVIKGKWTTKTNDLIKYNGSWFYVKNGKWNKTTDLIKKDGVYFFVKNGKWSTAITTLFKKSGKFFSIKGGKWSKTTQIITYSGKKFYCKSGFAQLGFTGKAKVGSKTYNIVKGQVK